MRLLLGIILGFLITVGGVYVRDSSLPANTVTTPVADRPMVNWDVVNNRVNGLTGWVGEQWTRLTAGNAAPRPPATIPPSNREPIPDPNPGSSTGPAVIPAPSTSPTTPGSGR